MTDHEAVRLAYTDQDKAQAEDLAKVVGAYMLALCRVGLERAEALELAAQFQAELVDDSNED